MKKLLVIVVLFCLSTLTFKTEAEEIKDKDFEEFFKSFQLDLKRSKGDSLAISKYVDLN